MAKFRQNLLVFLEDLVDTKLALLAAKWPDKYAALDKKKYQERIYWKVWDVFDVPEEEWNEAWNQRNIDFLAEVFSGEEVFVTPLLLDLHSMLLTNVARSLSTDIFDKVTIFINTYPYVFSSDGVESLKESLITYLPINTKINVLNLDLETLTPDVIKDQFDGIVMGELKAWLEIHYKALINTQIPQVEIYYPKVFGHYDTENITAALKSNDDLFAKTRFYLAEYVSIVDLDVALFSGI